MDDSTPNAGGTGQPDMGQTSMGNMGGVSQDERTHALLVWILMIFTSFIAPLIFFVIDKDKPFAYRHAAQALAYCLTLFCVGVGLVIVVTVLLIVAPALGMLMSLVYLAIWVGNLIIAIMGAMAANNGQPFDPPISSAVCKALFKV